MHGAFIRNLEQNLLSSFAGSRRSQPEISVHRFTAQPRNYSNHRGVSLYETIPKLTLVVFFDSLGFNSWAFPSLTISNRSTVSKLSGFKLLDFQALEFPSISVFKLLDYWTLEFPSAAISKVADFRALEFPSVSIFQRSKFPALQFSSFWIFKRSNFQALRLSSLWLFKRSNFQALQLPSAPISTAFQLPCIQILCLLINSNTCQRFNSFE